MAPNPDSVALVSGTTYHLTWLTPNEMLNAGGRFRRRFCFLQERKELKGYQ